MRSSRCCTPMAAPGSRRSPSPARTARRRSSGSSRTRWAAGWASRPPPGCASPGGSSRSLVERPLVRAAHKRIVWFSLAPDNPVVVHHRSSGGRAYLLADGWLVEVAGDRSTPLLPLAALPGAFGGTARYAAANALAAAAAAVALDVPAHIVSTRLLAFRPWA